MTNKIEQQFYYVFVPARQKPKHKHSTYESALQEAKRIQASGEKLVYVLKAEAKLSTEVCFKLQEWREPANPFV